MAHEYLEFETSPTNETCVQVSKDTDYMPAMRQEAKRMLELLEVRFPEAPGYFTANKCYHDFGTYLEIRYHFDDDDKSWEYANFIESNWPLTWSDNTPVKPSDVPKKGILQAMVDSGTGIGIY